jgi:uncharacterized membrane protein
MKKETGWLLILATLFSCVLVGIRVYHTGRFTFIFMIWNLFLAYVPFWISNRLAREGVRAHEGARARADLRTGVDARPRGIVRVAGLLLWLLFIPNSFYILTDLFHLADGHRDYRIPEWFDLVLILSFAVNGLLLGILSTRQVERMLAPEATRAGRWVFVFPVMILNGLGVYIGRYLRYNSWDIVSNPADLLGDILPMLVHPLRYHHAWDMILCYAILLTLLYHLLHKNHEPWKI